MYRYQIDKTLNFTEPVELVVNTSGWFSFREKPTYKINGQEIDSLEPLNLFTNVTSIQIQINDDETSNRGSIGATYSFFSNNYNTSFDVM